MFKKNKKAQLTFLFVFIISAIFIILLSAIFAPMMVIFNTEMYTAGEDLLNRTQSSIDNINDPAIRAQVQASIDEAKSATQTNIDVGTDLFQYGWVLLLILLAVVIYLLTRQTIAFNPGGLT